MLIFFFFFFVAFFFLLFFFFVFLFLFYDQNGDIDNRVIARNEECDGARGGGGRLWRGRANINAVATQPSGLDRTAAAAGAAPAEDDRRDRHDLGTSRSRADGRAVTSATLNRGVRGDCADGSLSPLVPKLRPANRLRPSPPPEGRSHSQQGVRGPVAQSNVGEDRSCGDGSEALDWFFAPRPRSHAEEKTALRD